jgi:hypothetical protein
MNYRAYTGLVLIALLFTTLATAQYKDHVRLNEPDLNRPRLFDKLPAEIPVSVAELNKLLSGETTAGRSANIGSDAEAKLSPFKGTIMSSAKDHQMRSVVIRSEAFNGATLTISSSTNADGTVTYRGRIISFKHGDAYDLQQRDGQYYFVKKSFYEMVYE